jgi:hypothetical protein
VQLDLAGPENVDPIEECFGEEPTARRFGVVPQLG